MRYLIALALITFFSSHDVKAQGADVLLKSIGDTEGEKLDAKEDKSFENPFANLKIDDEFLMLLFSEWRSQKDIPFEVQNWVMSIFQHKFEQAAHLWTAVKPKLPSDFKVTASVAQTYLYWKLELPQTFFDRLLDQAAEKRYSTSKAFMALDQVIAKDVSQWILDNAITIAQKHQKTIERLSAKDLNEQSHFAKLAIAWSALRNGPKAAIIVKALPEGHPLKVPLANSAIIYLSKIGELGEAGRILKVHVEPEIERINDPKLLAKHYLNLARLLYQAGALDASEEFYKRIPNSLPEYLSAQTELAWVYLRKGDVGQLRGSLATLSSPVFKDKFLPEVYLVRSISNLKLCKYEKVAEDFEEFVKINRNWAKTISQSLTQEELSPIERKDFYLELYNKAQQKRDQEVQKITELGKRSIRAALPAVGVQSHWTQAKNRMIDFREQASKKVENERRRYWKNKEYVLSEAIRKMRFVKVETMGQIRMAAMSEGKEDMMADQVSNVASAPKKKEAMVFKFDGVFWPDELFNLYSVANNYCLAKQN